MEVMQHPPCSGAALDDGNAAGTALTISCLAGGSMPLWHSAHGGHLLGLIDTVLAAWACWSHS